MRRLVNIIDVVCAVEIDPEIRLQSGGVGSVYCRLAADMQYSAVEIRRTAIALHRGSGWTSQRRVLLAPRASTDECRWSLAGVALRGRPNFGFGFGFGTESDIKCSFCVVFGGMHYNEFRFRPKLSVVSEVGTE